MPLTWIAILPINFYEGTVLKKIHYIITIVRFFQHCLFIVLGFIVRSSDKHSGTIFGLKIYIFISFVLVFILYYIIVIHKDGDSVQDEPASTNRTFKQLLEFRMYDELVQMHLFGFIYSDTEWKQLIQFNNRNVSTITDIVGVLDAFIQSGMTDMVEKIMETIKPHINQASVLHCAADGRSSGCVEELIKNNADVNFINRRGHAPLHLAAKGHAENMKILIKHAANVNQKDNSGDTPLHFACIHGSYECVDILIKNNVNVNVKSHVGVTPLHFAAENGHVEIVELLIEAGASLSINEKDNQGRTTLHWTASAQCVKSKLLNKYTCMDLLIKNNANVNEEDNTGLTPLDFALLNEQTESNQLKVSQLLVKAGGKRKIDIQSQYHD